MRAEVHHRTQPIEDAIYWIRRQVDWFNKSRANLFWSSFVLTLAGVLFSSLLHQPPPDHVPSLQNVARVAMSFEPLIYYSENGVMQIVDMQERAVAVWDLGESVRTANLTSGPILVKQLDELSESIKTLSEQLTKFFANVDGDVDK